jgi:hypothetical protein
MSGSNCQSCCRGLRSLVFVLAAAAAGGAAFFLAPASPTKAAPDKAVLEGTKGMLSHDVYFTLKDRSPESKQKIVAACKKYLKDHPGVVFFACGVLAEDLKREVNDREFDVGLHIVFKDMAAHDKYQPSDLHQRFIDECKPSFAKVRVFDTVVE